MNPGINCQSLRCRPWLLLILLGLASMVHVAPAATLNVTNFGAVGDCREVYVRVTTNSAVIATTNMFTAGDVGKVVQLFGAGYFSSLSSTGAFGGNYQGTPTNHQDLVATIIAVANGTNVTLSSVCGVTTNNIRCTYGTQNKAAFDNCITAAQSNDVIYIPAGNYLLMPPSALNPNYVQKGQFDCEPTITLFKGGLTFRGDGTNASILTGNGAWQQKGWDSAYRGYLFRLLGPVTNNGPLIFDKLQLNGNATRKHTGYSGWAAAPTDGSGWDVTHHAISQQVSTEDFRYISITNCLFTRWHGETIQGISTGTGVLDVGNCWFIDGNSTVINYNNQHDFHDNLVTDYYQVAEDGQFTPASGVAYIRNNVFSNIYGTAMIALTGAYTNINHPGYIIASNVFSITSPKYGIITAGAKNISILSNHFDGGGIALGTAGQQGTDCNRNYVIANNVFTNAQTALAISGSGKNRIEDVVVVGNSATVSINFAIASQGAASWSTNVVFHQNKANKGIWCTWATGQYFVDDVSNEFPPHDVLDNSGTNAITYGRGMRHNLYPNSTSAKFYLDTATAAQIPVGALLKVTNHNLAATLYTSTNLVNPIAMSNGYAATFRWTNGVWQQAFKPTWNPELRTLGPGP
jgi:hypothetical protein